MPRGRKGRDCAQSHPCERRIPRIEPCNTESPGTLPAVRTGDVISGRFELDRSMGSGGMGEVFRALDRFTSEYVAVKVLLEAHPQAFEERLHPAAERGAESMRFMREAEVLAELQH